jgi:hypothetical protein
MYKPIALPLAKLWNIILKNIVAGRVPRISKKSISFFMSVRLSARPHGTTRVPLDGFS